jgi:ATP-dependent 26S proteasome regulatory subunit
MIEQILSAEPGALSLDERLAALARARQIETESPGAVDRLLLERITSLRETLSSVHEQHSELRDLLKHLTAPPYFPAVFLAAADAAGVQGAIVQTENERRVVQCGQGVVPEELAPGDEVFLSNERNVVVAKSTTPCFLTGEISTATPAMDASSFVRAMKSWLCWRVPLCAMPA